MTQTTASYDYKIKLQRTIWGSKNSPSVFRSLFFISLHLKFILNVGGLCLGFFWRKVNTLSASTLPEEQLFSLFSSLHGITFAHFCCFPEQNTVDNIYRDALRNAGTFLADKLNVASDLLWSERWGHKGKCPHQGGLRRQGCCAAGSPGSHQENGVAAQAWLGLLGRDLSVGCCEDEPQTPPCPLAG